MPKTTLCSTRPARHASRARVKRTEHDIGACSFKETKSVMRSGITVLRWPTGIYRANRRLFKSRFSTAKRQAIS